MQPCSGIRTIIRIGLKKVNQFVHVPTSVDTQDFIKIHARVFSNLANRQTDKRTRAKTFTSSFVGGNKQIIVTSTHNDYLENDHDYWKLSRLVQLLAEAGRRHENADDKRRQAGSDEAPCHRASSAMLRSVRTRRRRRHGVDGHPQRCPHGRLRAVVDSGIILSSQIPSQTRTSAAEYQHSARLTISPSINNSLLNTCCAGQVRMARARWQLTKRNIIY